MDSETDWLPDTEMLGEGGGGCLVIAWSARGTIVWLWTRDSSGCGDGGDLCFGAVCRVASLSR